MQAALFAFFAMAAPEAVILQPVTNLYAKPSLEAAVVSQAIYSARVEIVEEMGDWARIRTADAYLGWAQSAAFRRLRPEERPYASAGRVARVENLVAHLYRDPSVTRHAPLITAPFEARLEVIAEPEADERRWIQVRLPDNRPAWIQRGDVSFDTALLPVSEAIRLSKRFLGLPYTWGGTSSLGYDCSGYTQMLSRRMGKSMPRDAQPQANWDGARAISKAELRPGDFVYFGASAEKITHTGMYIGGGEFIHSTAHRNPVVQISRLDEPHWTRLLVACRRLK